MKLINSLKAYFVTPAVAGLPASHPLNPERLKAKYADTIAYRVDHSPCIAANKARWELYVSEKKHRTLPYVVGPPARLCGCERARKKQVERILTAAGMQALLPRQ